jgi:hypothetical protein
MDLRVYQAVKKMPLNFFQYQKLFAVMSVLPLTCCAALGLKNIPQLAMQLHLKLFRK